MTDIKINNITDKAFVVVGNVDAGKSTLIGTLISDLLDNGRGSARITVAQHKHEILSGKTSSISTRILRFPNGTTSTLIDLCGHEKYFTTTATGIAGMWPDYAIVVISPTRGILNMTKQHFRMLMSYNIPVFIVVTKIDMALEESCNIVDKQIKKLCKSYKRKVEFMNNYNSYHSYKSGSILVSTNSIQVEDDIKHTQLSNAEIKDVNTFLNFEQTKMSCINEITQGLKMANGKQSYIPVIYISNVDGYYLDVVKSTMMNIEPRDLWCRNENSNSIIKFFRNQLNLPLLGIDNKHIGSTFYIDKPYNVKGIGIVISGINRGDAISINDVVLLGPINKKFIKVKIKSLHNDDRTDIKSLGNHHRGCVAIRSLRENIQKNQIKRGTVLITNPSMYKYVGYRFKAGVTIFGTHSTTLRTGYSPIIHAGTIRQSAKLIIPEDTKYMGIKLSKKNMIRNTQRTIKSNDITVVWFKFRYRPEFLDPGTVFIFRSGDIHGVGCVIDVLPLEQDNDAQPEPIKNKYRKLRKSNYNIIDKVIVG
jgi:elongation factor 1-alpha